MKKLFMTFVLCVATNLFAGIEFTSNPIQLNATEGKEFSADLKNYLVDSKISGLIFGARKVPSFLVMDTKGLLKGMPNKSGDFKFLVDVSSSLDGGLLGQEVIIRVAAKVTSSLECKDRSQAYFVGTTPDKKFDLFSCPR